jgi:hypothetical protein
LTVLLCVLIVLGVVVAGLEYWTKDLLARSAAEGGLDPKLAQAASLANRYLAVRHHVLSHVVLYAGAALLIPPLVYLGLRRLARGASGWREKLAGMHFEKRSYALANPFQRPALEDTRREVEDAFIDELRGNMARNAAARVNDKALPHDVLLGFDERGAPVYVTERARSMHVHLLGQTGSGKTQSVIYPLLYQDVARGRPIVFLDAKGSAENEEQLAAIAAACGRLDELFLLTLNPGRPTHTFNPVYLTADSDPRQVAERVFATFEADLDVQYYRDMARELWVNLVCALASTGKQMTMLDCAACIAEPAILAHALAQASDKKAVRAIQSRYAQLRDKVGMTYTGLLAAVNRYDLPLLNTYTPDIVLEDLIERGGLVGFSLSANAYKFAARAIGLIVLQHLQHMGALRQMDRRRSQVPLYVYADEFYSFAYEGFIDAVNKLRDANISMLLAHQDLSDLDRVSPEFARGVWGNTRNKIVLFQSDGELCDRLAQAVGTKKSVELTVRRTVDAFLNQASTLEASSREVDEFVLHPNRVKSLRTGQAYLVQAGISDEGPAVTRWWRPWASPPASPATRALGVNLAPLRPLPSAKLRPPKDPDDSQGLGLHALFVQGTRRAS